MQYLQIILVGTGTGRVNATQTSFKRDLISVKETYLVSKETST
jgi:hypothetical protein